jgi:penicillin-binding protein 2
MADLMALVANNGTSYAPHLVRSIRDADGTNERAIVPKVAHQIELDPFFWQTLKSSLVGVIEVGTGKQLKIAGLTWGGKTGSAEQNRVKKTHSWFVGIAPIEDPKIVVCVRVEGAGHGGEYAGPVVKKLIESYLTRASRKAAAAVAASPAAGASPDAR